MPPKAQSAANVVATIRTQVQRVLDGFLQDTQEDDQAQWRQTIEGAIRAFINESNTADPHQWPAVQRLQNLHQRITTVYNSDQSNEIVEVVLRDLRTLIRHFTRGTAQPAVTAPPPPPPPPPPPTGLVAGGALTNHVHHQHAATALDMNAMYNDLVGILDADSAGTTPVPGAVRAARQLGVIADFQTARNILESGTSTITERRRVLLQIMADLNRCLRRS